MKVKSFLNLSKRKKIQRIKIFCIGKVFMPTFCFLGALILMSITNLFVKDFFSNITASLQGFVENFVKLF